MIEALDFRRKFTRDLDASVATARTRLGTGVKLTQRIFWEAKATRKRLGNYL